MTCAILVKNYCSGYFASFLPDVVVHFTLSSELFLVNISDSLSDWIPHKFIIECVLFVLINKCYINFDFQLTYFDGGGIVLSVVLHSGSTIVKTLSFFPVDMQLYIRHSEIVCRFRVEVFFSPRCLYILNLYCPK